MKPTLIINLLLLLLLSSTHCGSLFYNFLNKNTTFYQCYRDSGFDRITLGLSQLNNTITQASIQNVANATIAGLKVQVLFTPCRNRTIDMEVQMLQRAFPFKVVDRYWLSPSESNTTACGWIKYSAASNCQFLQDLINRIQSTLDTRVGIIGNSDSWYKLFKDYQGCPQVGNSLLWWSPSNSSPEPNFNDYMKFGGWTVPYAKLYTSRKICDTVIIQSYYQSWNNLK